MCVRRPTSAMPKLFLCCERAFCRSMLVMFCALKWSVLMFWCLLWGQVMWWSRHLMRCTGLCCVMSRDAMRCYGDELYYSSTSLYYKVLQYYSVLQILLCTTPVLPCTPKCYLSSTLYYSSTTLYYKVLLKYYSVLLQYYLVLQNTTPVLTCTTKYYSSTTPHNKVVLQYYSVLQSTTPVLLRTTKYYSSTTPYYSSTTPYYKKFHDWSASHMKRYLQCAEQQKAASNFSKNCACHAKWISWLIRITYETSLTMRGATGITLQPHQILRLPRKMNLMIDAQNIWNVIYNARSILVINGLITPYKWPYKIGPYKWDNFRVWNFTPSTRGVVNPLTWLHPGPTDIVGMDGSGPLAAF